MTTLKSFARSVSDMRETLQREQGYSRDAKRGLLAGILLLRDCVDALERDINRHFTEREESIDIMLGAPGDKTEAAPLRGGVLSPTLADIPTVAVGQPMEEQGNTFPFPEEGPASLDEVVGDGVTPMRRKRTAG
jgi:hypothetical protein